MEKKMKERTAPEIFLRMGGFVFLFTSGCLTVIGLLQHQNIITFQVLRLGKLTRVDELQMFAAAAIILLLAGYLLFLTRRREVDLHQFKGG